MKQTTENIYREPGAGAIEFAKQYVIGHREFDLLSMSKLLDGDLHDPEDKRVKRCDYCGYFWRDDSLRNTKKTCSDDCKRSIKTLQRRKQREKQELLNPKPRKRTLMDDYVYWLEYPYWVNEYSMLKIGWKFERPASESLMDYIEAKEELLGKGNRKISRKVVDYHGDDRDDPTAYF